MSFRPAWEQLTMSNLKKCQGLFGLPVHLWVKKEGFMEHFITKCVCGVDAGKISQKEMERRKEEPFSPSHIGSTHLRQTWVKVGPAKGPGLKTEV